MNRRQYLENAHVQQFIGWLSAQLGTSMFSHRYYDRRSGKHWACESLYDAFRQYRWGHPGNSRLGYPQGDSSASNGLVLSALRLALRAETNQDADMLQVALEVMEWGGVTAGNAAWLRANQAGLMLLLITTRDALNNGDLTSAVLREKTLRFNSGMTKVYSLLCDNFVIYDSRVAAALGWAIVKYCQLHGLATVPELLCFPWAAAKEGLGADRKRRDPSCGSLKFKRLRPGSHHAQWNCKASWLMQAVLDHPNARESHFHTVEAPNNPLRALEAAFFMIGYDLGEPVAGSQLEQMGKAG